MPEEDVLVLINAAGQRIDLTSSDPTFEQTLTADLAATPVPTDPPSTSEPDDYSAGGAGGKVCFSLRLFDDDITLTALLRSWSIYWTIYDWAKYDENPKYLVCGAKTFCVHISRLNGVARAGQEQLISINLGLTVINPG
ncbi:MAG: hypothetical protein PHG80_08935 [Methanoregulaceae archaeon]|nr:hypothetical protein [Methanoregulaceae archaeon]